MQVTLFHQIYHKHKKVDQRVRGEGVVKAEVENDPEVAEVHKDKDKAKVAEEEAVFGICSQWAESTSFECFFLLLASCHCALV